MPQSFKTTTIVSTAAFLKACKQTEIIAREGNNVVRLSITAGEDGPGEVEISAQSEETGSSEVQVDATVTGTDLIVAFNVRYLRDCWMWSRVPVWPSKPTPATRPVCCARWAMRISSTSSCPCIWGRDVHCGRNNLIHASFSKFMERLLRRIIILLAMTEQRINAHSYNDEVLLIK